ncbi:MAG: hypothetical protein DHS80DRAFT_24094 [Piptocephalis tieghemiana]|nr:MAG: hypothetical protein DHS80DRAFT_24094 [Piptocephalis tieghemiana]
MTSTAFPLIHPPWILLLSLFMLLSLPYTMCSPIRSHRQYEYLSDILNENPPFPVLSPTLPLHKPESYTNALKGAIDKDLLHSVEASASSLKKVDLAVSSPLIHLSACRDEIDSLFKRHGERLPKEDAIALATCILGGGALKHSAHHLVTEALYTMALGFWKTYHDSRDGMVYASQLIQTTLVKLNGGTTFPAIYQRYKKAVKAHKDILNKVAQSCSSSLNALPKRITLSPPPSVLSGPADPRSLLLRSLTGLTPSLAREIYGQCIALANDHVKYLDKSLNDRATLSTSLNKLLVRRVRGVDPSAWSFLLPGFTRPRIAPTLSHPESMDTIKATFASTNHHPLS